MDGGPAAAPGATGAGQRWLTTEGRLVPLSINNQLLQQSVLWSPLTINEVNFEGRPFARLDERARRPVLGRRSVDRSWRTVDRYPALEHWIVGEAGKSARESLSARLDGVICGRCAHRTVGSDRRPFEPIFQCCCEWVAEEVQGDESLRFTLERVSPTT